MNASRNECDSLGQTVIESEGEGQRQSVLEPVNSKPAWLDHDNGDARLWILPRITVLWHKLGYKWEYNAPELKGEKRNQICCIVVKRTKFWHQYNPVYWQRITKSALLLSWAASVFISRFPGSDTVHRSFRFPPLMRISPPAPSLCQTHRYTISYFPATCSNFIMTNRKILNIEITTYENLIRINYNKEILKTLNIILNIL